MMSIKPKVSIITVCYNCEKSIEATILSVVNQTYSNIEYIIIDGGSKDRTIEIIKQYSDKITYWISEPDKGIYDAMNKGIVQATGEWINFRNSGDLFWGEDVLERFFQKPIDKDVIVVHGNQLFVRLDNLCKEDVPPILKQSYTRGMPVYHPSSFIRTSYHKLHPYNLQFKSSADYDFMYKCLSQNLIFEYRPICVATYPLDGFSSKNLKTPYFEDSVIRHTGDTMCGKINVYVRYLAMVLYHKILDSLRKRKSWSAMEKSKLVQNGWVDINELTVLDFINK